MSTFMDIELARRLEHAEGAVGSSFVAVSQRTAPDVGATWRDFAGTYAIFDGVDSPLTQTFGLGLFEAATPELLSGIEAFFEQRGAPVMHEVSPLAGIATFELLAERGYRPIELSTVLVQRLAEPAPLAAPPGMRVCVLERHQREAWIDTAVAGWSDDPENARIIGAIAERASANDAMLHFLVEHDGAPIATGSLGIHAGVALLAGASTVPQARGLGAQMALLAARLAEARRRGCELAMSVTAPGSTSQRNSERRGFRVAYTRTKWRLRRPG
jgi:GNAT superfamily N-acetyltransferase